MNPRELMAAARRVVAPVERRLRSMVRRGVLSALSDEGTQRATIDGLEDTPIDLVEVVEPAGFTSKPPAGAEAIAVGVGASVEHQAAWVFDRRHRVTGLEEGETAVYHAGGNGTRIILKDNGDAEIIVGVGAEIRLGEAKDDPLALHPEIEGILEEIRDLLVALQAAWAGLPSPLTTWGVDGLVIKAVWTGVGATKVPSIVAKITAAVGAQYGRG